MTRASAVLDRNVLVRLVGYRNGTEEAGAGFLQTWSSVARARRPSGLVYRNLARLFAEADVEPEVILYNLLEVIGPPQMSRAL